MKFIITIIILALVATVVVMKAICKPDADEIK